jgi:oligoendopeptidase F
MIKAVRHYLPESFSVKSWQEIEPFFTELLAREISTKNQFTEWLRNRSELDAALQEDLGWRYIRQTCDTNNEQKKASLYFFIQEIEPHLAEYADKLNRKMLDLPDTLKSEEEKFRVYFRAVKKETEIFRQENIPLLTEAQTLANEYGQILGAMSVEIDGKQLTLQQASNYLKDINRQVREDAYVKMNTRRLQDRERLDDLFDKLLRLRDHIARNAGKLNFRDYMFDALGRFDYGPDDCRAFHESVRAHILPLINRFEQIRMQKLGYEKLYPWDLDVDADLKPALKPFDKADDLIEKSAECFGRVKQGYGNLIRLMRDEGHLDLDSRLGKAPGGYNYPLYESGLPFIFMNAASSLRDMVTMMHEGGHAIHAWVTRDLELTAFRHTPSEIAEVASMAMELISMEHWDVFFTDPEELRRARMYQLEKILGILPWIATIDAFQHWLYLNPAHTRTEREHKWLELHQRFSGSMVDRSKYPDFDRFGWHKQLHIFEVPFYYIEYGIAQLGAIGIWRNYKKNPADALTRYENALSQGNQLTLPALYETAGVRFDFSPEYIRELSAFISAEMEKL